MHDKIPCGAQTGKHFARRAGYVAALVGDVLSFHVARHSARLPAGSP